MNTNSNKFQSIHKLRMEKNRNNTLLWLQFLVNMIKIKMQISKAQKVR